MGLNETASGQRVHIGFFGLRNSGKSSLVNRITGQEMSLVSDVAGTTTDPVKKAMELLPIGPVVIVDTPGFDDEGMLGRMRVEKTREILRRTDIAVLVTDASRDLVESEKEMIEVFRERKLPYIVVFNKADLVPEPDSVTDNGIYVSALDGKNIDELKELIGKTAGREEEKRIIGDILQRGDNVVLVVPVDESAPKGRLILPQQQTIRDMLDSGCTAYICQPGELEGVLENLKDKPAAVVTDSQAFEKVAETVPEDIPLTSFSILFARYKGELGILAEGAAALAKLKDKDRVLVSEGCTHHRQCNDIGTVKIPGWVREYCGKDISFDFTSGNSFPDNLCEYALNIHCGGCMLNEKEMKYRIRVCTESGVPVVNYGMAIAKMHGIFERSIELFKDELRAE